MQTAPRQPRGEGSRRPENRVGSAFRYSATAMFEVDVSRARSRVQELRDSGITDIAQYLADSPDTLDQYAPLLHIVDVNDSAIRLFEADSKEELLGPFGRTFDKNDSGARSSLEQVLSALAEGGGIFETESSAITLKGKRIKLKVGIYLPDGSADVPNALITLVDISRRVAAEERIRRLNRLYMISSDVNHAIAKRTSEQELFEDVCNACVHRKSFKMAWIGVVDRSSGVVVPRAQAGEARGYLDNFHASTRDVPEGRGPTGRAVRERTVVVCNNIEEDPQMAPWREAALERGFRSSASVSFGLEGSVQGVLTAYASEIELFGPDEISLLDEIGTDLSFALRTIEEGRSRKRSEEALAYERNLLRTLIDHIPDGIFAMDTDRRLTLVNTADVKVYGRESAEEVIGRTDTELFSPEIAANFEADNRAVIDEGRAIIDREEYYVDRKGRKRWLLTSKLPLRDAEGNIVGLVGVGRDITESRQAELQIRRQAQLLDIASDAIIVRAVSGEIRFWSRGAETVFGWSPEEAVGRKADSLIRAEEPALLEEALAAVIADGQWKGEVALRRRDDSRIIGEMRWNLVVGEEGESDAVLMVVTDITERRSVEERLLRAQRLESLGTLASGIAHDLNNVLTPILVGIDALAVKLKDGPLERILKVMRSSAQRGSEIVNQVLGFARGGDGERVEIPLRPILREIEEIIRETFPKTIQRRVHLPENLWNIVANRTQIHQVLMNLTVNARDAMEGQGTLTLTAENVVLDEAYRRMNPEARAQSYVVVSVEDTGSGMSQKTVERIFDPFFTTKGSKKGTGLGLSTSLTIVKAHGGFLNVYSEPGQGSSFRIYLPAAVVDAAEGVGRRSEELPMGSGETILVVDDEAAVREITRQILETHRYSVITAEDGTEALVAFNEHRERIALVLCDMVMPYLDGRATIQAIRKIDPDAAIIAMSGLASNRRSPAKRPAGVSAFLPKPYTASALLQTIRGVITGRAEPAG